MTKKGGNPQNLKPVRSKEEAKKRGQAGGIASGRKRAERKSMAEVLDVLLKMPMLKGPSRSLGGLECLNKETVQEANPSSGELLALAMLQKALKGDTKAMRLVLELTGEGQQVQTLSPLDSLAEELKRYRDEE